MASGFFAIKKPRAPGPASLRAGWTKQQLREKLIHAPRPSAALVEIGQFDNSVNA